MKSTFFIPGAVAVLLLLTAPVRSQEPEKPKQMTIDHLAREHFAVCWGATVFLRIYPGFEVCALCGRLAQRVPADFQRRDEYVSYFREMNAYPKKLIDELRREDGARNREVMHSFTVYIMMIRYFARLQRDDGREMLPVALGEHTEPIKVSLQFLVKSARGGDRLRAAAILLELVSDDAQASAIVAAEELRGEDKDRRILACELVETLRLTQPVVVTALVAAVSDKNEEVRQAAAQAVASVGPRAAGAVPGLIDLFKSGRPAYAHVLGIKFSMGKPHIHNVALMALAEMDVAAAPAIPAIRTKLAEAIDGLSRNSTDMLSEEYQMPYIFCNKLDELLTCLGKLGPLAKDAAPELRRLLRPSPVNENDRPARFDPEENRLAATTVLLRIDPADAEALDILKKALQSDEPKTRRKALAACAQHGPRVKSLVPLFVAALKDPQTAFRACEALQKMRPLAEEAIPVLAAISVKDDFGRDSSENFAALETIGKASVPALTRLLQDRDVSIRTCAARSLGQIGKDAASTVPLLIDIIKGTKEEEAGLRLFAAIALGRMKSNAAAAREPLHQLLERVRPENTDPGRPEYIYAAWAITQLSR